MKHFSLFLFLISLGISMETQAAHPLSRSHMGPGTRPSPQVRRFKMLPVKRNPKSVHCQAVLSRLGEAQEIILQGGDQKAWDQYNSLYDLALADGCI